MMTGFLNDVMRFQPDHLPQHKIPRQNRLRSTRHHGALHEITPLGIPGSPECRDNLLLTCNMDAWSRNPLNEHKYLLLPIEINLPMPLQALVPGRHHRMPQNRVHHL